MKSTISTLWKVRYRRDVSKVYRDVRDVRDVIRDVILTLRDVYKVYKGR